MLFGLMLKKKVVFSLVLLSSLSSCGILLWVLWKVLMLMCRLVWIMFVFCVCGVFCGGRS